MTNLTAKDVENITTVIFPSWKEACDSFLNSEMDILKFAKVYFDNVKKIEIDEKFNIFTAIAEKYRYENLHSDLLKVILGNKNNNIKNENIFYAFLDYIGITNPEQYFQNYEDIKFHREYPKGIKTDTKIKTPGFIDLLIYTETGTKVCIIIENKINGAPDQPDQLGRYRKMMKEEDIEILKTVYLTIDSKHTEPSNFNNYSEDFKVSKEELNFIHLPCVTEENQNNKSFTKFLKEIIKKNIGLNDTQRVFIEQYKLLLESIGGQVLMEQYKKDFIKDIMKDTGSIQTAEYFADNFKRIWDDKDNPTLEWPEKQLVDAISENDDYPEMADYLAKNFNEIWYRRAGIIGNVLVDEVIYPGMEPARIDVCDKYLCNKTRLYYSFNNYFRAFDHRDNNINIEFGFRLPIAEKINKNTETKLVEILKKLQTKTDFILDKKDSDKEYRWEEDGWIWYYHHVSNLGNLKYDKIKKELKNCLSILEQEAQPVPPPHNLASLLGFPGNLNLQNK